MRIRFLIHCYLSVKVRELAAYLYKRQHCMDNTQTLNHETVRAAKAITKHNGYSDEKNQQPQGQPWLHNFTFLHEMHFHWEEYQKIKT